MSKTITSPVKRFAGEVVLADPLTFPQVFAFEDAIDAARELGEDPPVMRLNAAMLPGVLACVEEFRLSNFPTNPTAENFPATPVTASLRLVAWLINEVTALFRESEEIPNE